MSPGPAPRRFRLPLLASSMLALGVLVVGCGDQGKITIGEPGEPPTTTAAEASGTSTTVDSDSGTTTTTSADDSTPSTTAPGGSVDPSTGPSAVPADQDAIDNSWIASPGEYRGQDGLRVAYLCPPAGSLASLWGTGPFTDDSSVCTAAVFAGLITTEGGGRIVIEIAPGRDAYDAGEANGVTASAYGTWAGSFTVVPTG